MDETPETKAEEAASPEAEGFASFAHHAGESEEQTADAVAALEREREYREMHDEKDARIKEIDGELKRIRGAGKTNRLRRGGATRGEE